MAAHICTLLEAQFDSHTVSSWFHPEAQQAAAGLVWDPEAKHDELKTPLHGAHQSWELLDNFDDFDEEDSDQPAVAF